jgi:hypothetical protein
MQTKLEQKIIFVLIVCIKIGKKTIKGNPNKKFIGRSQQ